MKNLFKAIVVDCPKCGSEASEAVDVITTVGITNIFRTLFCSVCQYKLKDQETKCDAVED